MHIINLRKYISVVFPLIILAACGGDPDTLHPTYIIADQVDDIYHFEDSLIKPIDYINLISLEQLPIEERKITFVHQILPSILICKYNLELQKRHIEKYVQRDSSRLTRKQKRYLDSLYVKYKTRNPQELLRRLETHPVSIVLAQAALESAWGTSRFYTDGNNVFGVWSFNASDKRMTSAGVRDGKPVYVKRYHSLSESVADYFLVLGRGPFSEFRKKRLETRDPYVLVEYLGNYSEQELEYAQLLKTIIRTNNLTRYDKFRLDPEFIR